jgi:hypothetical protein
MVHPSRSGVHIRTELQTGPKQLVVPARALTIFKLMEIEK